MTKAEKFKQEHDQSFNKLLKTAMRECEDQNEILDPDGEKVADEIHFHDSSMAIVYVYERRVETGDSDI